MPYRHPITNRAHSSISALRFGDDVGLGKTIEAGLILRELLLRRRVDLIVVAAPPSMLLQWQDELWTRFGLRFVILDREFVTRMRRERGFGVNPWATDSRFLRLHSAMAPGQNRHRYGRMGPRRELVRGDDHRRAGRRRRCDDLISRAAASIAAHRTSVADGRVRVHDQQAPRSAFAACMRPKTEGSSALQRCIGDLLANHDHWDIRVGTRYLGHHRRIGDP